MVEEVKGFDCKSSEELIYLYFETDNKKTNIPLNIAKKIPILAGAIDLDDTILNNENNPIIIKKGFHSSRGLETIIEYVSLYLNEEEPTTTREPIDEPCYLEEIVTDDEATIFEKNKVNEPDEFWEMYRENIIHTMALAYYFGLDELTHKLSKCCAFIMKQYPEYYELDKLNERLRKECPSSDEDDELNEILSRTDDSTSNEEDD